MSLSENSLKQQILSSKDLRDKWLEKLIENPSNSEAAQHIIGANEIIRTLWYYLGEEDKYSDEFYPYARRK